MNNTFLGFSLFSCDSFLKSRILKPTILPILLFSVKQKKKTKTTTRSESKCESEHFFMQFKTLRVVITFFLLFLIFFSRKWSTSPSLIIIIIIIKKREKKNVLGSVAVVGSERVDYLLFVSLW